MWGASLPSIHFAFACDPTLKTIHWCLVCGRRPVCRSPFQTDKVQVSTSAGGCILLTLHPAFLGPTFRQYRALVYTCFGLSAVLFISHSIFLYGFAIQKMRLSIEWMALMGFLNIAGAVVYASRVSLLLGKALSRWRVAYKQHIPERWFPTRFDFVGASHQIFHLLVLAAGLVHYKALIGGLHAARAPDTLCVTGDAFAIQSGLRKNPFSS
jgi:adiponectin receptor